MRRGEGNGGARKHVLTAALSLWMYLVYAQKGVLKGNATELSELAAMKVIMEKVFNDNRGDWFRT